MAKATGKKAPGPVDKALGKLNKQNSRLRKRITKDVRRLSDDAATAASVFTLKGDCAFRIQATLAADENRHPQRKAAMP